MNRAKLTITYKDSTAYTLYLRTFSINDPLSVSLTPGGQVSKSGLDQVCSITGECTLSLNVYNRLREGFLASWNSNAFGTLTITYEVPGVLDKISRTFNKALIKSLNHLSSIQNGAEVLCRIEVSAREEEGVNDYFSDPLVG